MPTKSRHSIVESLNAAQLALRNTVCDEELLAQVALYGYPMERINAGLALQAAAVRAVNARHVAAGAQQQATAALEQAEAGARDAYRSLAQVARAVGDKAARTTLGLTGPDPVGTADFLGAAYTLVDNAGTLTALADYGYDKACLSAERQRIVDYDRANQVQEAAKAAVQQAAQEQEAALAALDEWVRQYLNIAKVALRGRPQLLEKLGVTVRTNPTAAQRASRAITAPRPKD